ncbi:MAG: hypothetical protein HY677_03825, partial [Chloroflexi bacterium]|nr:hypothetical protein [Chloroflexota bacterium]
MMLPQADIDQLKKILQHEGRTGYRDSAVVGGLDGYLRRWAERSLAAEPALRRLISHHRLQDGAYGRLDTEERREWVASLLSSLSNPNGVMKADSKAESPSALKRPATKAKPRPMAGSKQAGAKLRAAKAPSAKAALVRKPRAASPALTGPVTIHS